MGRDTQTWNLNEHWQHLNDWLVAHRRLWQPAPFTEPQPEWTKQWPELARYVAGFSDGQCQALDDDPVALSEMLAPIMSSLGDFAGLTRIPAFYAHADAQACTLPEVRARDMPGRKRLQSGAFTAAIRPLNHSVVDWCCGKGHLARTLRPFCGHSVSGFEWNPALVSDGNRLAQKSGDSVTLRCQDVMADGLSLPESAHGVALHACGDLHRRLIQRAAGQALPRLSVSPCCFHLTQSDRYQPLSTEARQWPDCLKVAPADLRLAVEETVTAPARVRDQVQRFSQWRLGFDVLQRELRGFDEYLPVPSHPNRVSKGNFTDFCRWAAAKKGLVLPDSLRFGDWEVLGVQRLAEVRRHELIRHLFRRPLELWLVLDYGLFLQEQGYQVSIGTFCSRQLTPRNLLIDAVREV